MAHPHSTTLSLKPKDLMLIPHAVAQALRADGWYLRGENIWAKALSGEVPRRFGYSGSCMPESPKDRFVRSHEQVFLLSKSPRYYFDQDAVRETASTVGESWGERKARGFTSGGKSPTRDAIEAGLPIPAFAPNVKGRIRRTVWTISTKGRRKVPHFATYPPDLIRAPILASTAVGDLVLDPFAGAGTTGLVALELGRRFIGIELNETYAAIARGFLDEAIIALVPNMLS